FTIYAPVNFATMFPGTKSASTGSAGTAPFKLSASALTWLGTTALKSIGSGGARPLCDRAGVGGNEGRAGEAERRAHRYGGRRRTYKDAGLVPPLRSQRAASRGQCRRQRPGELDVGVLCPQPGWDDVGAGEPAIAGNSCAARQCSAGRQRRHAGAGGGPALS